MIGKFTVDYQDDLIVHSNLRQLHIKHLREFCIKCRVYGISLNPKKCLFSISEGQLLGYIVRSKGIYIDPVIIQAINELKAPIDRKLVHPFFGKINFVCRFILDYASIVKPITKLLRKNQDFEWTPKVQREFANIKVSIASSLIMVNPSFDNHFILYFFSSEDTITTMLTQKIKKKKNY